MTLDEKILLWSLLHQKQLGIEILELTWPRKWAPHLYDYSVQMSFHNRKLEGRGTSSHQKKALSKAFTELYERCCLVDNHLSHSNGLAAGTTTDMAHNNAICELYERDLFLSHFLSRAPMVQIDNEKRLTQSPTPTLQSLKALAAQCGASAHVFSMGRIQNFYGVAVFVFGLTATPQFGLTLGLGCHSLLHMAANTAAMESIRKLAWILGVKKHDTHTLDTFYDLKKHQVDDHLKLAFNPQYASNLQSYLNITTQQDLIDKDHSPSSLSTQVTPLFLKDPTLSQVPLYFMYATSKQLQSAFTGPTTIDKINRERLSQFGWNDFKSSLPHPLG